MADGMMVPTKTCPKCKVAKLATAEFFYRKKHLLRSHCKDCMKEYWSRYRKKGTGRVEAPPEGATRICRLCKLEKPATAVFFREAQQREWGLRSECRPCANEASRRVNYTPNYRARKARYKARLLASSPSHLLRARVSVYICNTLKQVGARKQASWLKLFGYSCDDLRAHLERQFKRGMSWDNYGRGGWHIDHIVPVSAFKFAFSTDPEFRACWALSNLRPLLEQENIAKRDTRTHLL